jgi:hypothetical protein
MNCIQTNGIFRFNNLGFISKNSILQSVQIHFLVSIPTHTRNVTFDSAHFEHLFQDCFDFT